MAEETPLTIGVSNAVSTSTDPASRTAPPRHLQAPHHLASRAARSGGAHRSHHWTVERRADRVRGRTRAAGCRRLLAHGSRLAVDACRTGYRAVYMSAE